MYEANTQQAKKYCLAKIEKLRFRDSPVSVLYPTIFSNVDVHLGAAIFWRNFGTDAIRVRNTRKSPSAIAFCCWAECTTYSHISLVKWHFHRSNWYSWKSELPNSKWWWQRRLHKICAGTLL